MPRAAVPDIALLVAVQATGATALHSGNLSSESLSALNNLDNHTAEVFDNYPPSLLYFAAFFCVLFITVGVPGNAVTVLALGRSKRVRNATAAFIINLSLADLMLSLVNLPLAASNFLNRGWIHGAFLCELSPLLRYGNVAVSLLSVMVITINRFVMITHPKIYPRMFQPKAIAAMILAIWLVSFGPLVPTWAGWWGRFGFDAKVGTCTIIAVNGRSPKSALFVLAFVLPCLIIILCYVRIFCVVRDSRTKARGHGSAVTDPGEAAARRKPVTPLRPLGYPTDPLALGRAKRPRSNDEARDMRLLKMILVIFGAFLVCYLPMTIVKVLGKEEEMPVLNIFSYVGVYLTSCTNPIVYVVMSREYRRAYIELFTCKNSNLEAGEPSETSRTIGLSTVR